MDKILSDEPGHSEKRIVKPERTRWHRFVRYTLSHNFDCKNKLELTDAILQCHLNFGHGSLHQAPGNGGFWVWSTDLKVSGFLAKQDS